jgi:hypothetical protein
LIIIEHDSAKREDPPRRDDRVRLRAIREAAGRRRRMTIDWTGMIIYTAETS